MANHLDWLPGTVTALVSGAAAWLASWVTLRRYRRDRADLEEAKRRGHLNGAIAALGDASAQWRQLYEVACVRIDELEAELAELRDRVKRGLV